MKPVATLIGSLTTLVVAVVLLVTVASLVPIYGWVATALALLPVGVPAAIGAGLFVVDFLSHRLGASTARPTRTAAMALLAGAAAYAVVGASTTLAVGTVVTVPGVATLVVAAGAGGVAATVVGVVTVVRMGGGAPTPWAALGRALASLLVGALVGGGAALAVTGGLDPAVWPVRYLGIPVGLVAGLLAAVAAFVLLGRRRGGPVPATARPPPA